MTLESKHNSKRCMLHGMQINGGMCEQQQSKRENVYAMRSVRER